MTGLLLAIGGGTILCIVAATMASMLGADGVLVVVVGVTGGFVGLLLMAILLSHGS